MFIKPKNWLGIFFALWCGLASAQQTAAVASPQQNSKPVLMIQTWQTKNGASVFFVRTPEIPMVNINVVFAAGSGRDGNYPGIAQFTANMLNEGTPQLNADQIADSFDAIGAQYNVSVNRDMAVISLQSLSDPKYLTSALSTFTQVLTTPNFPERSYQRTQKQTLVAIAQQQQAPDATAAKAFYENVYSNHPYGHPIIGTQESMTQLTLPEITNFYKKYYVAKNAIITIVGNLTGDQAETISNQLSEKLATGEAAPQLPAAVENNQAKQQQINFPSAQTHILMGQVGITYQDPNYFPLLIGNYILGGAPLTSQLFLQVREQRGLAYSVGSGFMPLAANGPFVILVQTRNGQAQEAYKITQETLANFLKLGPSTNELTATKKKLINGFPLTIASNGAISSILVTMGFYHLPLNYLDTYRQKIADVNEQQVKTAFQKILHPEKMVTVMVGNLMPH